MTNSYVHDLKAEINKLDLMLMGALIKGDCDAIKLVEESLEEIVHELDMIKHKNTYELDTVENMKDRAVKLMK